MSELAQVSEDLVYKVVTNYSDRTYCVLEIKYSNKTVSSVVWKIEVWIIVGLLYKHSRFIGFR